MSNDEIRKKQHEKLRELIQPLGDALAVEPADPESDEEEAIWDEADTLYHSLLDFFENEAETIYPCLKELLK